ncbi:hypothetical protein DYB25_003006 [Aphanomyces astaci]|uniref:HSF-type DNA-binding domain-containing protein n=2 Tax=Aphanomyces astaci TaxID=112090 RepID=A0A397DUB4_APHAT|nr:hypothetical protein DYB25_003006 [Aphanomyces astaci]RHY63333.1 hypothetical protein DYB38_011258 [Aphanomyces astaci]RHY70317.1 hypothetical protein DYB30_003640 [Aphanomyces astaci]
MSSKRTTTAAFIRALYNLTRKGTPFVDWSADGTTFRILDIKRFASEVLPHFFKHSNMASFQRQLNYFSFKKWTKNNRTLEAISKKGSIAEFHHPYFTRDMDESLLSCFRRKVASRSFEPLMDVYAQDYDTFGDASYEHRIVQSAGREKSSTVKNVVTDFLQSDLNVSDFVKQLQPTGCNYAGFNLVMFDGESLGYYCNLNPMGPTPDFTLLERDVLYGISNSVLGTPWIKVERGKAALADVLAMHKDQDDLALCRKLIRPMVDTTRIEAPELLPQTGCPEAMEYQLSSIFVEPVGNPKYPKYGTRTTIAMVVDGGHATILEKDLDPITLQWNEHTHSF